MALISRIYDDTQVSLIPDDAVAAAGYIDGNFVTYPALRARFGSRIPLISITVLGNNARIADDEAGDMNNAQTANWLRHVTGIRKDKPGPYTSASNVDAMVAAAMSAGVPRSAYVIWSAHYTGQAHICGPSSCGACRTSCDATQFTDRADNESLDETLATSEFISGITPHPPPAPADWTEKMISNMPTVSEGNCPAYLAWRVQGLVVAVGHVRGLTHAQSVTMDGAFGPATKAGVIAVQSSYGLSRDGVVGPQTWSVLVAS